jgi:vacuolar protein sorting-associated protein 13A/C
VVELAGDLTLHNLHLKKSAVEKYNLPVEVVEGKKSPPIAYHRAYVDTSFVSPNRNPPGHIGHLHITIPWFSLRTNPVHIQISDVFLLVKMRDTSQESVDPQEDERKDQEAKQEKLRNAESLDAAAAAGQGAAGQGDEGEQAGRSEVIGRVSFADVECIVPGWSQQPNRPGSELSLRSWWTMSRSRSRTSICDMRTTSVLPR